VGLSFLTSLQKAADRGITLETDGDLVCAVGFVMCPCPGQQLCARSAVGLVLRSRWGQGSRGGRPPLAVRDPDVLLKADRAPVQMGAAAEVRGAKAVADTFKGPDKDAQPAPARPGGQRLTPNPRSLKDVRSFRRTFLGSGEARPITARAAAEAPASSIAPFTSAPTKMAVPVR